MIRATLLLAALIFLAVAAWWHSVAPACIAAAGGLLIAAVAAGDDRFTLGAALAAYAVRSVLAAAFQWVAGLDLPQLQPLLQSDPSTIYKFWIVARDSFWYHIAALQTLTAWQRGTELPPGTEIQYFVFVAFLYRVFGPNPLNAVLWNALFGALAVIVGTHIATRLAGRTAARVTAVLIAAWPSAILWSTQMLKDAACLWVTLALLALTMRAVEAPPVAVAPVSRWLGLLAAVFATSVLLHQLRYYVVAILVPACAVFVLHALIRRTRETPGRMAATGAVIVVMALAVSASRRVDLERLFGPSHPEAAHVRAGLERQSHGDLAGAGENYRRALKLVPDYPPALRNLAAVDLARGERAQAVYYLRRYLAYQPQDEEARAALSALIPPPASPTAESPGDEGARPSLAARNEPAKLPTPPGPTGSAEPLAPLAPMAVSAPSKSLTIVGPGSDLSKGTRTSDYGSAVRIIAQLRRGFATTGGGSATDSEVGFDGYLGILRYMPRGLGNTLLAPYPWQWFDARGSTGPFKALSALEAVLMYVLIVPLLVGLGIVVVRGSPHGWFLATFVATLTLLLGLVVGNIGTLFRLRLETLLPLFTTAGVGSAWLGAHLPRRRLARGLAGAEETSPR
jgi:Dolichyl-phosphate-mannose-protein mannosyltransferase